MDLEFYEYGRERCISQILAVNAQYQRVIDEYLIKQINLLFPQNLHVKNGEFSLIDGLKVKYHGARLIDGSLILIHGIAIQKLKQGKTLGAIESITIGNLEKEATISLKLEDSI